MLILAFKNHHASWIIGVFLHIPYGEDTEYQMYYSYLLAYWHIISLVTSDKTRGRSSLHVKKFIAMQFGKASVPKLGQTPRVHRPRQPASTGGHGESSRGLYVNVLCFFPKWVFSEVKTPYRVRCGWSMSVLIYYNNERSVLLSKLWPTLYSDMSESNNRQRLLNSNALCCYL